MKRSPSPSDDEALDEAAAEWLCEREAGFTAERNQAFAAWCASDPRHAAAVQRVEATLRILDELPAVRQPLAQRLRPGEGLPARTDRFPLRPMLLWCSGLAAAILLGLMVWRSLPGVVPYPEQHYSTARHMQESIALADGSVMDVNVDSEVSVQFTAEERRVTLRRGEAHFQVAANPARPFIVTAGGVSVRAVGTAFEVRLTSDALDVVVVEGKVALDRKPEPRSPAPPEQPPLVVAGQHAQVALDRLDTPPQIQGLEPAAIQSLLTWRAPVASFTDVPLRDVITRLNRRNPMQLVLADQELGNRKIGGRIALDQVDAFVRLLEQDGDVIADRATPGQITLRGAR